MVREFDRSGTSPSRRLRRRYIFALVLIGVLALFEHVGAMLMINERAGDSVLINLAGRQRMLSQKISKAASAGAEEELAEAVALWSRTHNGLKFGDTELGLDGENSEVVDRMYASIDPHFNAINEAIAQLLMSAAVGDLRRAKRSSSRPASCTSETNRATQQQCP